MEFNLSKTNRIFYITNNGELFVQFRRGREHSLACIAKRLYEDECVCYLEELVSGNVICGTVVRVTKSGVALKDWSIK